MGGRGREGQRREGEGRGKKGEGRGGYGPLTQIPGSAPATYHPQTLSAGLYTL